MANTEAKTALFVTPGLGENSLGRTQCLWDLVTHLGWRADVISDRSASLWTPVLGSAFADSCRYIASRQEQLALARRADVIVSVKPFERSLGLAADLAHVTGTPLLADVDDPDADSALSWARPVRRAAKSLLRPNVIAEFKRMRRILAEVPVTVSNPVLQVWHGGVVIPHVRSAGQAGSPHVSSAPVVAFIGTNRPHKGIGLLRAAIDVLQSEGFTLVITDSPPADRRPWERWVGTTSLDEGRALVAASDVVVIPTLPDGFSKGQLPAKLIDAMLAARGVLTSDIEPMPWACGDVARTFRAGSLPSLIAELRRLRDPATRTEQGERLRRRALEHFTVEAVAPAYRSALDAAMA